MKENKLIAVFMGVGKHYEAQSSNMFNQYHISWDWLMPVVEKILDITFSDDETEISNSEYFYDIRDCVPNINHTYRSIVEFINQYNKNK